MTSHLPLNKKRRTLVLAYVMSIILAACGGATAPPGRTILLCCGNDQYSKIASVASSNGINLLISPNPNDFDVQIDRPYVWAAIYAPYGYSDAPKTSGLLGLQKLLHKGGRVFVFYMDHWADENERLQQIFGISITKETVASKDDVSKEFYSYDRTMLPAWLADFQLVATSQGLSSSYKGLSIWSYLVVPGDTGIRAYAVSQDTRKNRLVYYASADKSRTFFPDPALLNGTGYDYQPFIHDAQIGYGDNAKAALALLKYLLDH